MSVAISWPYREAEPRMSLSSCGLRLLAVNFIEDLVVGFHRSSRIHGRQCLRAGGFPDRPRGKRQILKSEKALLDFFSLDHTRRVELDRHPVETRKYEFLSPKLLQHR